MYTNPAIQEISDTIENLKNKIVCLFKENLSDVVKIEENSEGRILFKSSHKTIIEIYLDGRLLSENKFSLSIEPNGTKGRDGVAPFSKVDATFFGIINEMISKSESWVVKSLEFEDFNEKKKHQIIYNNEFGLLIDKYDKHTKGY